MSTSEFLDGIIIQSNMNKKRTRAGERTIIRVIRVMGGKEGGERVTKIGQVICGLICVGVKECVSRNP
jgi:hypothetical protein